MHATEVTFPHRKHLPPREHATCGKLQTLQRSTIQLLSDPPTPPPPPPHRVNAARPAGTCTETLFRFKGINFTGPTRSETHALIFHPLRLGGGRQTGPRPPVGKSSRQLPGCFLPVPQEFCLGGSHQLSGPLSGALIAGALSPNQSGMCSLPRDRDITSDLIWTAGVCSCTRATLRGVRTCERRGRFFSVRPSCVKYLSQGRR